MRGDISHFDKGGKGRFNIKSIPSFDKGRVNFFKKYFPSLEKRGEGRFNKHNGDRGGF